MEIEVHFVIPGTKILLRGFLLQRSQIRDILRMIYEVFGVRVSARSLEDFVERYRR